MTSGVDVRQDERVETIAAVSSIAADLGVPCRVDEPLAPHTTMGVGGPAPCFLEPPSAPALAALVRELTGSRIGFRVLGAGSNVIVDERGLATPVISMASLHGEPRREGDLVTAPAGTLLPKLVRQMASCGLGGFEFLEGIPGSVGGALVMNAGAGGQWIGDVAVEVQAITPGGELETIRPRREEFRYRGSFVTDRGLVAASVTLRGLPDDPGAIHERIRSSRAHRVATQPLSERSSGCIFKNPDRGEPAGALLDRLGLKGTSAGGAAVSEKHANFIVNRGGTFGDILRLVETMRERARREAGVDLQLEVMIWRDE